MTFERLTSVSHPLYSEAIRLYQASFPPHEQRQLPSQERILADDSYHFCLIRDQGHFVGLVLYWETAQFLYIEHFCILPELRNHRYGQRTLELLTAASKPVILEIDPPVDALSLRRKGFYERCGFCENPFPHRHPPYHRDCEGHPLVVLSCPGPLTPTQFDAFSQYLTHRVMKDAFI